MITEHKPPRGTRSQDLRLKIETERETDGRWIAEIPQVPGALAYGTTNADDVEHSQDDPPNSISLERHIA